MNIPFLSLHDVTAKYRDEIHEAVLRVVDSGWYLQGKENEQFEKHYAEYIGSKHCIGCANGLDALIWIFRAYIEMGVMQPGDEVIVPANTYIATILAITENNLVPVLVEPNPETLQIDDTLIEECITDRTKAICIVHLYGRLAYTPKIKSLCEKYGLKLIEDNAQAHGCKFEAIRREGDEAREWLFRVAMVANAPICCEMECSEAFTEGVLRIASDCQDVRFCIDNALMLLFAFRTAPLMTLEMHAAVVVRPSLEDARGTSYRTPSGLQDATLQDATLQVKGYLFLGHSGTGKSTHARQWLVAFDDAWLLNDDNPILRVMEDGEVRVYGSPWSGKTPCYNNAYARVGGIVKLSQAPHNKIRTISLPEAYAYILSSASGLKMDRQMADHLHETVKHVVMNVECYHLECLPNTEAAEECWEEVRF